MRLLETARTPVPQLREFLGSPIPPYAILSHTWDDDEVTLQQLAAADLFALHGRQRFLKVQRACALARTRHGLRYVWVDTCCIDKTSSAELTEAINSMFAWYRDAEVCYVYLSDLEPGGDDDLIRDLPACRWFTRGWTLQELVAPRKVLFFDRAWRYRGTKEELAWLLSTITNIPVAVLRHEAELGNFAVARRMSWAANRETTRLEDMAYCLLGIFDVHLSLIYGEGIKAFARLQAAILQTTSDMSIFAWVDNRGTGFEHAGILATRPAQFAECREMEAPVGDSAFANFTMTTRGIRTDARLVPVTSLRAAPLIVALDIGCRMDGCDIGVHVRKIGGSLYVRCKPDTLFKRDMPWKSSQVETLTLATTLPTRFPFHPGLDPVVGNRCTALRVRWGPFEEWDAQHMPRSHFDTEHQVFFSCDKSTKGWCAYVTEGALPCGSIRGLVNHEVYLKLFFACFNWNNGGPPIVIIASLNAVDLTPGRLLQSLLFAQLDQIGFESYEPAKNLVLGAFRDNLGTMRFVHTALGPVELYEGLGSWTQLHPDFRVRLKMQTEVQPNVCATPIMTFDFSFTVNGALAQASPEAPTKTV